MDQYAENQRLIDRECEGNTVLYKSDNIICRDSTGGRYCKICGLPTGSALKYCLDCAYDMGREEGI